MNILILGSGGREAAIAACLEKEGRTVYALPGNGGIANSIPGSAVDRDAVLATCRKYDISYCVVTPDDPLALGCVDALEAALAKHAAEWPDEPGFMVLLARLRLLQGRPDDALEIVETVPAGSAADFEAQLVAAGAFLAKNRPEESMQVLERAIQARPKDPRPYFNMAVAFLRLPTADPDREIAARFYAKSVSLGGKRSYDLERRLNME